MFVIPPIEAGVTLHTIGGAAKFFESRRLLFRHLGWQVIRRFVGPRLDPEAGTYYVVVDAGGNALTPTDFTEFAVGPSTTASPCSLVSRYRRLEALAAERNPGPVPGTGRRPGGNAYRCPRTRAERRENIFFDRDAGEPPPRAARSWKSLASSWDELVRSDYRLKSWKHYRKQQWKD